MRIAIVFLLILLIGAIGAYTLTRNRPIAPIAPIAQVDPLAEDTLRLIQGAHAMSGSIREGLDHLEFRERYEKWTEKLDEWYARKPEDAIKYEIGKKFTSIRITGGLALRLWDLGIDIKELPRDHEVILELRQFSEGEKALDATTEPVNLRSTAVTLLGVLKAIVESLPAASAARSN